MRILSLLGPLALTALVLVAGCDDDPVAPVGEGQLILEWEARIEGNPLSFDQLDYLNAAGNAFAVDKFEFLLSDLALVRDDGLRVSMIGPFYGNAFAATPAPFLLDGIPEGNYLSLEFHWGVAPHKNVTRAFGAEFDGMLWPEPMGGGYHCMRFEGDYISSADDTLSYAVHTGRLQMPGTERVTDGTLAISLAIDGGLMVQGDMQTLTLAIDPSAWWNDPVYDLNAVVEMRPLSGPTMPNHGAQELLRDNGDDVFSLIP